ncbi:hypothetical protein RYX36_006531 [Vicia faba]
MPKTSFLLQASSVTHQRPITSTIRASVCFQSFHSLNLQLPFAQVSDLTSDSVSFPFIRLSSERE